MKQNLPRRRAAGYVSYVMVLSLAVLLTGLMLSAYRKAMISQGAQGASQLQVDYANREDAVLRSILNIAPNRAMRAMMNGSRTNKTERKRCQWRGVFIDSLKQANARVAVDDDTLNTLGLTDVAVGNSGDVAQMRVRRVFGVLNGDPNRRGKFVSAGVERDFGEGFPVSLDTTTADLAEKDRYYPIIATGKHYGDLASGTVGVDVDDYPQFNLIPYPRIHFGYAQPGQLFVAKRNWWGFRMDLSDNADELTGMEHKRRDFVLSIYEIPSQLAISASAFANIGQHADGTAWQNTSIEGGVFASKAQVRGPVAFDRLSGRRGISVSEDAVVGGESFSGDLFDPGVREAFELQSQRFFPVSLASEAGRAVFIPINRGIDFFDRFGLEDESGTVSSTKWNDYTSGAKQCAMYLDVVEVNTATDQFPTALKFSYMAGGVRQDITVPVTLPSVGLPPGYVKVCDEHETVHFNEPVDVAYGARGHFAFQSGVSGDVTFDNARFGDPIWGVFKAGYAKASYPWEIKELHGYKPCIELYPERIPAFLASIHADGPEVNSSICINVDYPSDTDIHKPAYPCLDTDIGVILKECGDLTGFTKGFSLVTNLRLYIGDDFNVETTTPPAGSGIPTPFYPPASLFSPEKRYGTDADPYWLKIKGQMGSLAGEDAAQPVRLLDLKLGSEAAAANDRIEVNLKPISHPAALPPINMMNWLVVIEERRRELYGER
jgi:hypothetical protein